MRALAYLGLVCLTGVSFEVRAASHALVLRGVEIVQGQGADAGVTYELECGEKLFGVLVREVDHAVGIAVVLDRPEVGCSLMAEHKTLALPFLSTRGRDLVSLPTNEVTPKVQLQEITSVTSIDLGGVRFSWDNTCRPFVGVVFAPGQDGRTLQAGMAMRVDGVRKHRGVSCSGGQQSTSLTSIKPEAASGITVMNRPGRMDDLYALRVVAPQKLTVGTKGDVQVVWQRNCHEMPVGVLFAGPGGSNVALVTAFFPNVDCADYRPTTTTYSLEALAADSTEHMVPVTAEFAKKMTAYSYGLRLSAPARANFSKMGAFSVVTAPKSCDTEVGTVVGNDASGNLSVGALGVAARGVCAASSGQTERDLPLVAMSNLQPRVFPLRIAGTRIP